MQQLIFTELIISRHQKFNLKDECWHYYIIKIGERAVLRLKGVTNMLKLLAKKKEETK